MVEPQEEIWVFGGNRVNRGKRVHAWLSVADLDTLNSVMLFPAKGSFAVGSEYRVRVSRSDGRITKHGEPSYHQRHDDDGLRSQLQAEHMAAERTLRVKAYERKDGADSALLADIEPILATARKLRPYDREILALWVYRQVIYA